MLRKLCFSISPRLLSSAIHLAVLWLVEEVVQSLSLFDVPALCTIQEGLLIVYNGILCSAHQTYLFSPPQCCARSFEVLANSWIFCTIYCYKPCSNCDTRFHIHNLAIEFHIWGALMRHMLWHPALEVLMPNTQWIESATLQVFCLNTRLLLECGPSVPQRKEQPQITATDRHACEVACGCHWVCTGVFCWSKMLLCMLGIKFTLSWLLFTVCVAWMQNLAVWDILIYVVVCDCTCRVCVA